MGEVVQLNSYRRNVVGNGSKATATALTTDITNAVTGANAVPKTVHSENLSTILTGKAKPASAFPNQDSLIPIELAVGSKDRNYCLTRMAKYDVCAIHIRMVEDDPQALLYLMSVNDAIWLNKEILEDCDLTDEEVSNRIDLIQMLENVNGALMDSLWDSFTERCQAIII